MAADVLDPFTGETIAWEPLSQQGPSIIPALGSADFLMRIGAFGTCGSPDSADFHSWRHDHLFPVLDRFGLTEEDVFNPEVAAWDPRRAPVESAHFARDRVLEVTVTNDTPGASSTMEAGFSAYGGVHRGQDVFVSIELNDSTPEESRRGRMLARLVLEATAERYPFFSLLDDVGLLSLQACSSLADFRRNIAAGVDTHIQHTLPSRSHTLRPAIYLSGTSGAQRPQWMRVVQDAVTESYGQAVEVDDSFRMNWDDDPEQSARDELEHKLQVATQLIAITSETESLGALAELGTRIMHADLAGQSIGVYIEPHDSALNSETNRTRTLAKAHIQRLLEDFPHAPFFVAKDLKQLAFFGLSEHFRHEQRQLAAAQRT